jgi:quercetin dioxygenase-like cupin family protein
MVLAIRPMPALADHGLPHVEQLARGQFFDDVAATFRAKIGRNTTAVNLRDASDLVVLRITIEAGGYAPWHTHSGTGFLVNLGPGTVTNAIGEDCAPQLYYPGDAFADPGNGALHAVRNDSDQEVVLIAVFFGIEDGPVTPVADGEDECTFLGSD